MKISTQLMPSSSLRLRCCRSTGPQGTVNEDHELSEVFTKTLEYCQTFSKYNSKDRCVYSVHTSWSIIRPPGLSSFCAQ